MAFRSSPLDVPRWHQTGLPKLRTINHLTELTTAWGAECSEPVLQRCCESCSERGPHWSGSPAAPPPEGEWRSSCEDFCNPPQDCSSPARKTRYKQNNTMCSTVRTDFPEGRSQRKGAQINCSWAFIISFMIYCKQFMILFLMSLKLFSIFSVCSMKASINISEFLKNGSSTVFVWKSNILKLLPAEAHFKWKCFSGPL